MHRTQAYDQKVHVQAYELYANGMSVADISKELSIDYKTLLRWKNIDKWSERNVKAFNSQMDKIPDSKKLQVSEINKEHLEAYTKLRDRGLEKIDSIGDDGFEYDSDAIKAIDIGVQGERKVLAGIISLEFIRQVLQILSEEIYDDEIRKRIATRLISLADQIQRS